MPFNTHEKALASQSCWEMRRKDVFVLESEDDCLMFGEVPLCLCGSLFCCSAIESVAWCPTCYQHANIYVHYVSYILTLKVFHPLPLGASVRHICLINSSGERAASRHSVSQTGAFTEVKVGIKG